MGTASPFVCHLMISVTFSAASVTKNFASIFLGCVLLYIIKVIFQMEAVLCPHVSIRGVHSPLCAFPYVFIPSDLFLLIECPHRGPFPSHLLASSASGCHDQKVKNAVV